MKITVNKSKHYSNQQHGFGLKVYKLLSRTETYKHQLVLFLNWGYKECTFSVHWGKAIPALGFEEIAQWQTGKKLNCYNSEETCQLREGQEYTLRNLVWKNEGNGFIYPKVSLMELSPEITYGATRFLPQGESDEE
jgi:hypothetical protein